MGKAQQLVFSKNGVKTILDLTNPTITYQTIQTNSPRQLGEIVTSATPLDDPNLDILDGQYVSGMEKPLFFNYLETTKRKHPDMFVDYGVFDEEVENNGECKKFGIDPENLSDKPQNIRLPKYKQGDLLYYIVTDVKSDVTKPIVQAEVHDEYEIDPDLATDFYLTLQTKNCDFKIKQPSKPNQKYELHFWIYQKKDNSTCTFPQNVRGPQNNKIDLYISYNYVTHFTLTTITGGEVWMYNYDNFWFAPVVSGLKSPRYKVTVVFEFLEQNKNDLNGQTYNTPCLHNFRIWDDYTNSLIKFPGPEYMPDGTGYGSSARSVHFPARSYAILSNQETVTQMYYTKNDFDAFPMKPHNIKCYFHSDDLHPATCTSSDNVNGVEYVGWHSTSRTELFPPPFITDAVINNTSERTRKFSPFNCFKCSEEKVTSHWDYKGGWYYQTIGRFSEVASHFLTKGGSYRSMGGYSTYFGKPITETTENVKLDYTFYTNHPITRFSVNEGLYSVMSNPHFGASSYTRKLRVSMYWDDQLKKTQIYDRTAGGTINFALDSADRIEDVQYTPEVELPSVRDADLNMLESTMEYKKPYTVKVSGLVGGSVINQTKPVEFNYTANLLGEVEIDVDPITDFNTTDIDLEFDYLSDREHRSVYSHKINLYTPNQISLDYEKLSSGNLKFNVHGGVKDAEINWIFPENPNFDSDGLTVVVQKDETYDADGNGTLIIDPTLLASLDTVKVQVKFAKQTQEAVIREPQEPTPEETEPEE
jgi:hypothetical protein